LQEVNKTNWPFPRFCSFGFAYAFVCSFTSPLGGKGHTFYVFCCKNVYGEPFDPVLSGNNLRGYAAFEWRQLRGPA